jgi:hypothetical protein
MDISHSYDKLQLEQINDGSGIVCSIIVRISSTDGIYDIESSECIHLDINTITNFIEYKNLTEEIVFGWLDNHEDVNKAKEEHIKWINLQKNPPKPETIIEKLPWL